MLKPEPFASIKRKPTCLVETNIMDQKREKERLGEHKHNQKFNFLMENINLAMQFSNTHVWLQDTYLSAQQDESVFFLMQNATIGKKC